MMRTAKTLEILSYGRKPLKPLAEAAITKIKLLEPEISDHWPVARSLRTLAAVVVAMPVRGGVDFWSHPKWI